MSIAANKKNDGRKDDGGCEKKHGQDNEERSTEKEEGRENERSERREHQYEHQPLAFPFLSLQMTLPASTTSKTFHTSAVSMDITQK